MKLWSQNTQEGCHTKCRPRTREHAARASVLCPTTHSHTPTHVRSQRQSPREDPGGGVLLRVAVAVAAAVATIDCAVRNGARHNRLNPSTEPSAPHWPTRHNIGSIKEPFRHSTVPWPAWSVPSRPPGRPPPPLVPPLPPTTAAPPCRPYAVSKRNYGPVDGTPTSYVPDSSTRSWKNVRCVVCCPDGVAWPKTSIRR